MLQSIISLKLICSIATYDKKYTVRQIPLYVEAQYYIDKNIGFNFGATYTNFHRTNDVTNEIYSSNAFDVGFGLSVRF